ncbi:SufE family protein [Candidatus Pacearchaeota archaeon]|nr:SufE family protein [Candidatus Pacearchaeota archaeon]
MLNYLDTVIEEIKEAKEAEKQLGMDFGPYTLLMDIGKKLPPFPKEYKTEKNLVTKCRSTVYIIGEKSEGKVVFFGDSDSIFVKGELAVLLKTFSGLTPKEIIDENSNKKLEEFLNEAKSYLPISMSRSEGFYGMYEKIKKIAEEIAD